MSNPRHSDAIAKNDEGARLFMAGDLEGAISAFSLAIELNPDLEHTYRRRAQALRRLARMEEAEADLEKAESIASARQTEKAERTFPGTCSRCGQDNPPDARFCKNYGEPLAGTAFKRAFAWTAIPIVALSIASTVGVAGGEALHGTGNVLLLGYFLWFAAAVVWLLTPLAAISFAIARRRKVASGILAGFGVGVLALSLTCFANLASSVG